MKSNRAFTNLMSTYRCGARSKGRVFDLSEGEFRELTSSPCYYCGIEPQRVKEKWNPKKNNVDKYYFNGIDRIDSNEGYVIENCLPCCTRCNRMKMELPIEDFFDQIRKIYGYRLKVNYMEEQSERQSNHGTQRLD